MRGKGVVDRAAARENRFLPKDWRILLIVCDSDAGARVKGYSDSLIWVFDMLTWEGSV